MNQLFSPEDESIVRIHDELARLVEAAPNASAPPQLSRLRLAELIDIASTTNPINVPFWGYLMNANRTICQALTGH